MGRLALAFIVLGIMIAIPAFERKDRARVLCAIMGG